MVNDIEIIGDREEEIFNLLHSKEYNMDSMEQARQLALAEMHREDDMGYPVHENAGSFAIYNAETGEGFEEFDAVQREQCCGKFEGEVVVGGNTFVYTFDYGH